MGEHEEWAEPSGLLPNGLVPDAGPVIRVLDSERWSKAEERTAELIACIKPDQPSEERRNAVADYVQRLIMKCFPCQVVLMFWLHSILLEFSVVMLSNSLLLLCDTCVLVVIFCYFFAKRTNKFTCSQCIRNSSVHCKLLE